MGARADAIKLFTSFRNDDWFKDAFFTLSWTEIQSSGGNAFGGGTTVEVVHTGLCNKSSDYPTISQFNNELVESSIFVKGLIDEIGTPKVDTEVTFNGKQYFVVDYRTDPTEAIVSIQMRS